MECYEKDRGKNPSEGAMTLKKIHRTMDNFWGKLGSG